MDLFIILTLEEGIGIFAGIPAMGWCVVWTWKILLHRCESSCNFCLMMEMARSTSTDLKRVFIWYDVIYSPSSNLMDLMCSKRCWMFLMWWGECPTSGLRMLASSLATHICHHMVLVGMWSCTNNWVPNHLTLGVTLHTSNGAICGKYNLGKYNILSQSWWSHVACHGESSSDLANILFYMTFKLYIIKMDIKQIEKRTSTYPISI